MVIQGVQFKTEPENLLLQGSLQRHCASESGRHRCRIVTHKPPVLPWALPCSVQRYHTVHQYQSDLCNSYISGRWRSSEELVGPPGCCHVVVVRFHHHRFLHCQPSRFPHGITSRHAGWVPGRPRQAVQDTVRPTQQFSINDLLQTDGWHRGEILWVSSICFFFWQVLGIPHTSAETLCPGTIHISVTSRSYVI